MNQPETLVGLMTAGTENLILNLDFIPPDKFTWKPEPTAKSVAEIVNHLLQALSMVNGQFAAVAPPPTVTDAVGAKEALQQVLQSYQENLRGATPELLAETVQLPQFQTTRHFLVSIAVVDTIHHHGQIAYLQTLLGDEENHLGPRFMELLS